MSFNIKGKNPNYLARIVRLPDPQKHPGADRLQIVIIDSNSIITGLTAKKDDIYIYFPLESALNKNYLSWSNSFSSPELNKDKTKKGFFPSAGRVKAVKLRSAKSEGYIIPITDIQTWLKEDKGKTFEITEDLINLEFDHFDDILISEKFINRQEISRINQEKQAENRKNKKKARVSKIIDNQFRFHYDTEALGRHIDEISPDDLISISYKLHGTSGVTGKVLCMKPLKWYERFLKKIGVNIVDTHYDLVFSSRSVIKNQYADTISSSYYDTDLWAIVADKLKDILPDSVTAYYEIVGFTPSGASIQKGFDYGLDQGKLDFYIYRLTTTTTSGRVFEFSWTQIKDFCNKYDIKHVPELFYGRAGDFDRLIAPVNVEEWRKEWMKSLSDRFLEKNCYMCKNSVPSEGVVVRKDFGNYDAYKYKSFAFRCMESELIDTGFISIEDIEANLPEKSN